MGVVVFFRLKKKSFVVSSEGPTLRPRGKGLPSKPEFKLANCQSRLPFLKHLITPTDGLQKSFFKEYGASNLLLLIPFI